MKTITFSRSRNRKVYILDHQVPNELEFVDDLPIKNREVNIACFSESVIAFNRRNFGLKHNYFLSYLSQDYIRKYDKYAVFVDALPPLEVEKRWSSSIINPVAIRGYYKGCTITTTPDFNALESIKIVENLYLNYVTFFVDDIILNKTPFAKITAISLKEKGVEQYITAQVEDSVPTKYLKLCDHVTAEKHNNIVLLPLGLDFPSFTKTRSSLLVVKKCKEDSWAVIFTDSPNEPISSDTLVFSIKISEPLQEYFAVGTVDNYSIYVPKGHRLCRIKKHVQGFLIMELKYMNFDVNDYFLSHD